MSHPYQYSVVVTWAGNLETERTIWIADIPEFGGAAKAHGLIRQQAVDNAQLALESLILAYQSQGVALPTAEGEGV
ncbi:type II toxin-antitoxin system HicB family antitoxin [Egbenema bharatensis]|uniref:type II toxin-antitoxin system HicB family antitoxin n=1 Tax=Egbenema bharatensis TaxID=3463334 RepID=UPI003A88D8BE